VIRHCLRQRIISQTRWLINKVGMLEGATYDRRRKALTHQQGNHEEAPTADGELLTAGAGATAPTGEMWPGKPPLLSFATRVKTKHQLHPQTP
jgi:hypothetical protein